ncbi:hypothetical protein BHUM_03938c [Candidatus Burkholderia humilis]|nr:hypothetical protein BHUM_03938c [Candidatus Burkholderia humilis]
MFDVFTEEIEVIVKDGLSNLYWYKADLHKAWLRSGVAPASVKEVANLEDATGKLLTKRSQMDALYQRLRSLEYNRRLEISRNFVRILVEQEIFTQQAESYQIQKAQLVAFRLKNLLEKQNKEQEARQFVPAWTNSIENSYDNALRQLYDRFVAAHSFAPQPRGLELEKIFVELMRISNITVVEPFRIKGKQLDGAIKHDRRFYLIELKWTAEKSDPEQIGHFYYKLEGKIDGRGLFISMSGFTDGVLNSLPRGKNFTMMLLDGVHLTSVLVGQYRFQQLWIMRSRASHCGAKFTARIDSSRRTEIFAREEDDSFVPAMRADHSLLVFLILRPCLCRQFPIQPLQISLKRPQRPHLIDHLVSRRQLRRPIM